MAGPKLRAENNQASVMLISLSNRTFQYSDQIPCREENEGLQCNVYFAKCFQCKKVKVFCPPFCIFHLIALCLACSTAG